MWDLANRGIILLISLLSGYLFLYNGWGPVLAVTFSLFLVTYACYSLIVNDSLLSPHALLVFDYLKATVLELGATLNITILHIFRYTHEFWTTTKRQCSEFFWHRMERRRGNNYQLSNDSCASPRNSSTFQLINQLSPIPKSTYRNDCYSENKLYYDSDNGACGHNNVYGKHSSTGLSSLKKCDLPNGDFNSFSAQQLSPKKVSPMYSQNHTLSRGESTTYFSPEGSPWGTSISPKLRAKAGGVKTVQTVAGPLLASTRYNIDPKLYTDITSPGLTTRLTKYATEANNKLIHQPQYNIGQFPRVNLFAGPVPVINAKAARARMPVTVRVAPPEAARYSPPERQKILSSLCQNESKATPSVVQVLREISLKRHASREDVTSDLVKKKRTEGIFKDELENVEEIKQKRSRDESSKSEEDISPQGKTGRPTKRSKTPSCYGILNSLSSSKNVVSGIKRKAIDSSRSGTPEFEKHFKSQETLQSPNTSMQSPSIDMKQNKSDPKEKLFKGNNVFRPIEQTQESRVVKGILKSPSTDYATPVRKTQASSLNVKATEVQIAQPTTNATVNLTNKLFMKAEPQRNEQLKSLIEEQGHLKAKFTTDDIEEIRKEDIVNMRQTSMRARLQSMFDAISGKASRINPDVVIQADEVSVSSPTSSPTSCVTLNSSTTTTHVNTMPISTSAVAPFLSPVDPNTRPIKPAETNTAESQRSDAKITASLTPQSSAASPVSSKMTDTNVGTVPSTTSGAVNNAPLSSHFSFGNDKPASSVTFSKPATSQASFGSSTAICNNYTSNNSPISSITSASSMPLMPSSLGTPNKGFVVSSSSTNAKSEANIFATSNLNSNRMSNVQSTAQFTSANAFSNAVTPTTAATATMQSTPSGLGFSTPTTGTMLSSSSIAATTTSNSTITSNSVPNTSAEIKSVTSTASLFTFGNNSSSITNAKTDLFAFGGSGNVSNANTVQNPASTASFQATPFTNSTVTTSSSFLANNPASTSASGFTTNVTTTASLGFATSSFPFTTVAQTASDNKSVFSFGTTSTTTTSNPTPAFGTISSGSMFGTTVSSAQPLGSTSLFGNTSTPSTFNTTSSQSIFGAPTSTSETLSSFNTPKTTSVTQIFGPSMNTPSSTSTTTTSSLFSSINTTTNVTASTTSSSVFGASTNIFGQTKPTPFMSNNNPVFGNGTPTATATVFGSQTTTASTFGTTNSSGSTTSAFSTTNVTSPVFSTQNLGMQAPSQNTTPQLGNSSSIFGSEDTSIPAFWTPNTAAPTGFGSTMTNAFGGQNAGLAFGNANNIGNFTDNKPSLFGAQASTASAFGTPSSTAPVFGTSGNNNTTSLFSFGGNQKPAQQNPTFNFGGGNVTNNNAASSTPFQFGAAAAKPATTGFNFSAAATTPSISFGTSGTPTFSAPTPGMFNIGSGSTAPRSRTVRPRKPR